MMPEDTEGPSPLWIALGVLYEAISPYAIVGILLGIGWYTGDYVVPLLSGVVVQLVLLRGDIS